MPKVYTTEVEARPMEFVEEQAEQHEEAYDTVLVVEHYRQVVAELVHALAFYADDKNHWMRRGEAFGRVRMDGGQLARVALGIR